MVGGQGSNMNFGSGSSSGMGVSGDQNMGQG